MRVVQGFKCLLKEIFSQQTPDGTTTSPDVSDAMDSPSTTTSTLVGGVNVKGPLKVQEYYQLLGKKQLFTREIFKYTDYFYYRDHTDPIEILWQVPSQEATFR